MENGFLSSRRDILQSSLLGLMALSIPSNSLGKKNTAQTINSPYDNKMIPKSKAYPAIASEITSEVVGKAHSDLEGLKKLVDNRPELARATWDWRFGDWETAIGAAAHVGRRDIIEYLISKGARPDIFTFTTLGSYAVVRSIIESTPGIHRILGPHGISLFDHARAGLRMKDKMTKKNIDDSQRLLEYLETLEGAKGQEYLTVEEEEKLQYLGDYKYGPEETDGFTISLNMRKMISLGEIGTFGGALYKLGENKFMYQGAPSVLVTFQFVNNKVISLTIQEPNLTLVAKKD